MRTTDTGDNEINDDEKAETAIEASGKPLDDTVHERLEDESETLDESGDEGDEVVDPLLRAQLDPSDDKVEKPAPKAQEKSTKEAPKKPNSAAKAPEPAARSSDNSNSDDDKDLSAALDKMPDEDWGKLSHKAKSQFLSQQKIVRSSKAAAHAAREEAVRAKSDFDEVEKFRETVKLSTGEFIQSAQLGSAIKHGRKDAIPFLEGTLANLRKIHGIEEPKPSRDETPQIDVEELAKLVEGAQNYDLDAIGKLHQLVGKLRSGSTAKQAAKPAQKAQEPVQQELPSEKTQQAPVPSAEAQEFHAIYDALIGAGVAEDNVAEHVKGLLGTFAAGSIPPPGKRLSAIMRAHISGLQKPAEVSAQRIAKPPVSGRSGAGRRLAVEDSAQPKNPLNHAIRR